MKSIKLNPTAICQREIVIPFNHKHPCRLNDTPSLRWRCRAASCGTRTRACSASSTAACTSSPPARRGTSGSRQGRWHPAPLSTATQAITAMRAVLFLSVTKVVYSRHAQCFMHEPLKLSPLGTLNMLIKLIRCAVGLSLCVLSRGPRRKPGASSYTLTRLSLTLCVVVPGTTQVVMYPHLGPGGCVR